MRAVFLGPPGAGKGTQAALLWQRRGIPTIASGEILREAIRRGDSLGENVRRFVESGALVPDDLVSDVILRRLEEFGRQDSFVLDGFPRTETQARALDEHLARRGQPPLDVVVDFEISEEKLVQRLAGRRTCTGCGANYHEQNLPPQRPGICDRCGAAVEVRGDDRPETIRRRIEVYHRQTEPLVDLYRSQSKLRSVPADGPIEEQYRTLIGLLEREQWLPPWK